MRLMNEVVFENKSTVLDVSDIYNIQDVIVVKDKVINDLESLIKYIAKDINEYDNDDIDDLTNYVSMSFDYDFGFKIDTIEIDSTIIEVIKEYINDYYE